MYVSRYEKNSVAILLLCVTVCLMSANFGCDKKTKFDIISFFEDYGLNVQYSELVKSEVISYNGKKLGVGVFRMQTDKWDDLLSTLKDKYKLIDHFQKNDMIDHRNKNILCVFLEEYSVYPFQIYSTNVYFYIKHEDGFVLIKCLIDFC